MPTFYKMGLQCFNDKNYKLAIKYIIQAVQEYDKIADTEEKKIIAYSTLASCFRENSELDTAIIYCTVAMVLLNDLLKQTPIVIPEEVTRDRLSEKLKRCIDKQKKTASELEREGDIYYRNKQYDAAMVCYTLAVESDKRDLEEKISLCGKISNQRLVELCDQKILEIKALALGEEDKQHEILALQKQVFAIVRQYNPLNKLAVGCAYFSLAASYEMLDEIASAIQMNIEAITISRMLLNENIISVALDHAMLLSALIRCLQKTTNMPGFLKQNATSLEKIGDMHYEKKRYDVAYIYYKVALDNNKNNADTLQPKISQCEKNVGDIFIVSSVEKLTKK